jgi:hypothetical protein
VNVNPLPSLFVLSLPRSLSSHVYRVAAETLRLEQPTWVTDGEILNADRLAWVPSTTRMTRKAARATSPLAGPMRRYLDVVVRPHGWAYKDVIQPFVTAKWTRDAGLRTLAIRGSVAGSAVALIDREEWWPAEIVRHRDRVVAMLKGLVLMQDAIESASHAVHVDVRELMADGDSLRQALARLYPEIEVPVLPYAAEPGFVAERARVFARFETPRYQQILGMARIMLDMRRRARAAPVSPRRPSRRRRAATPEGT